MKNSKPLLLVLGSALLLFVVGTAYAVVPRITWEPNPLVTEGIAPGEEASYPVTLKNTGYLPILAAYQLRIDAEGAIAPYVTIEQPEFPKIFKSGQQVTFSVKVSVPDDAQPGTVDGQLALKRVIRKKVVDVWRAEPLPVSIQVTTTIPPSQAVLGPLADAEIHAYQLGNLITPIEGPITANANLTDLELAGSFRLALAGVPDDEWILVTATGGQDIDANDDGVIDPAPTVNLGTIHALARAGDWRSGGLRINVLTEIAWQALEADVALGQIDELDGRLRWIAHNLLEGDVTGDGDLDYRDLVAFDPRSEDFRKSLDFPFATFLAEGEAGWSFFDEIHMGREQAERDWIAAFFGEELQTPRVPEIVDVVTEVQLPANRAGLQGQDLLVSSVVSSGAQILDQGATLILAEDAAGRLVLLAFALPGEVAQLSPRSTALALVMLPLGGSRDANVFLELAAKVAVQPGFDPLVASIQNILAADPFFLDHVTNYVDLIDQVKAVVAAVKAVIAIAPAPAPAAAAPLLQQMSLPTDRAAEFSLPIAKADFYCIPLIKCSPWHESEPWDWYGDAEGAEALWPDNLFDVVAAVVLGVTSYSTLGSGSAAYLSTDAYVEILPDFTHAPFLSVAQENQTEIGLANPGAAHYALELITADGSVGDWFLTPRNSSLFDKLLNSGAAERSLYSTWTGAHRRLEPTINHVRFKRYPSLLTSEGLALGILNQAHLAISILNIASDFTAASKVLDAIAENESALDALGTCTELVTDALQKATLLSWWDATLDTASYDGLRDYLHDVVLAPVTTVAKEFASPKGVECIGKAAKKVGADWAKVFGDSAVAFAADTVGTYVFVKIALDAVNDTFPTALSTLWPRSEQQDYYLTWDRDSSNNPILVDVSTVPLDAGFFVPPTALFSYEQRAGEGLMVRFDASASILDPLATPTFSWDFGDGAAGSGDLVSHTYGAAGQVQVHLTVDDGLDQTDPETATITVRNGVPPVIEDMTCGLDPSDARLVVIDATVTDGDGDLDELQWWSAPPVFDVAPAEITAPDVTHMELTYPDDGISAFSPTLRARDHAGNVTERTCTVFPSLGATSLLNDTGITLCGDVTSSSLPCPVDGFPGQDAEYGLDVTHNDDSDGHAGFSFTKLDEVGKPLLADALAWTCVRDNVTGLIWEVKTDDGGLRDADNTYTWYNPDAGTNGGSAGRQNGGACSGSACDTQAYVQAVNAQGLCGANDWRLPDPRELLSISNSDRYYLAIDTAYFPNTRYSWCWSSSPSAGYTDFAWSVEFFHGGVADWNKIDASTVRLVRAGQ